MKNVLTFGIKCAALAIKFLVIYGQDFVVAGPADSKAAALIQGKNYIYISYYLIIKALKLVLSIQPLREWK